MSDRASQLKANLFDDAQAVINPATEDKQDDAIENQTDGTQKSQIVDSGDANEEVDVVAAADDSTDLEDASGLVTNAVLNGRISNTAIRPLRIDSSTHSIQTIEYEHHEVHSGSNFKTCDVQSVDTTTMKWQITTPAGTKYSHVVFDIEGTGEISILITEGSDRIDGTALTEINRNRVGTPTVAGTIVTRTPTGGNTDGATAILLRRTGATGVGGKTLTGGGSRGMNEFVLKPGTKYVVAVETFAAIYVSFLVDFYEHTDKN